VAAGPEVVIVPIPGTTKLHRLQENVRVPPLNSPQVTCATSVMAWAHQSARDRYPPDIEACHRQVSDSKFIRRS